MRDDFKVQKKEMRHLSEIKWQQKEVIKDCHESEQNQDLHIKNKTEF